MEGRGGGGLSLYASGGNLSRAQARVYRSLKALFSAEFKGQAPVGKFFAFFYMKEWKCVVYDELFSLRPIYDLIAEKNNIRTRIHEGQPQ